MAVEYRAPLMMTTFNSAQYAVADSYVPSCKVDLGEL